MKDGEGAKWNRAPIACLAASLLSCGGCGVLMMSEGPVAGGSIGWQPGQELAIRGLALLTLTLWIAAGWTALRSRR